MLDSVTMNALSSALDGLAARQRAIANNVANINTPGYRAERGSFEDALAASVEKGSGVAAPTMARSAEPARQDGSNVNLDTETISNVDTVLRYQFATQAVTEPVVSLRAAMRTS